MNRVSWWSTQVAQVRLKMGGVGTWVRNLGYIPTVENSSFFFLTLFVESSVVFVVEISNALNYEDDFMYGVSLSTGRVVFTKKILEFTNAVYNPHMNWFEGFQDSRGPNSMWSSLDTSGNVKYL